MQRNIEINKAIGAASSCAGVLKIAQREAGSLNLVNCVTALGRIAKLAQDPEEATGTVAEVAVSAAEQVRWFVKSPLHGLAGRGGD